MNRRTAITSAIGALASVAAPIIRGAQQAPSATIKISLTSLAEGWDSSNEESNRFILSHYLNNPSKGMLGKQDGKKGVWKVLGIESTPGTSTRIATLGFYLS